MNKIEPFTLECLISVYPLLNVYRGILTIESERVHLEMKPNKRVQWNFLFYQKGGVLCYKLDRTYSGVSNKRTGTLINFQKKCTRYALIRCYFATMDLISVPEF